MTTDRRSMSRLGRDTMLYGIGTVLTRMVSFIMLPVYTRYLTPADYGLLQILDLALEVASILISAGATAGIMRFYFKADTEQQRRNVLFTGWITQVALNLAGTALLMLVAPLIWHYGLSEAGTVGLVRIAACNFTLGTIMFVPTLMLQADQRPLAYISTSVSKLILQLSLNILFLVGFHWGPRGVLLSTFTANLAIGLVMSAILLRRTGISWSWPTFRDLRRFAVPTQFSRGGAFILAYGDRFFLEKLHGLGSVGVYGLAYQFGFLISGTIAGPFMQAWSPQRWQLVNEPPAVRDARMNRGFLFGDLIIITAAVGIALFIRPIIRVMTTPEFHSAAVMVPVILLAYVFQVWNTIVDFGISVSERIRYTSLSTWISVVVVLVLYSTLIPRYAGMGAAVATLIAVVVRFFCTLHWAQRLWRIEYRWVLHVRMLVAGTAIASASFLLTPTGLLPLIGVGLAGFALYVGFVWNAVLEPSDRALALKFIRNPRALPALIIGG
ncbi:MAG TPA: oligosaccharide flippase family protein [Gemmatimonadales bacterium]|nr:oligosaccharide flippase family protein [Gemmatimonadales bacterium]